MKAIVFIFVPVYIDRKVDAPVRMRADDEFRKVRRVLFARDRPASSSAQPFWTWFVENPRPSSAHQP
jgi:hypothetical protein